MGATRWGSDVRRLIRVTLLLVALLGIAACGRGGGVAAHSPQTPADSLPGAVSDPPRPAAPLRLTAGQCTRFDIAAQRGRVVLVFFGFTACPDICPTTLARWTEVRAALGADTSRVRFVFASIDPEHDTPALADAFAKQFHPSFIGLSGT